LSFPIPKGEKNQRDRHKLSYEDPQLFSHNEPLFLSTKPRPTR
jgi:hypothetical protein